MKNIFIASSSLQLLNCIEARYELQTQENCLILLLNDNEQNKLQIESLLDIYKWDKVLEVAFPVKQCEKLTFPYTIRNKLNFEPILIENIVVGEFRCDYTTHIVNLLSTQQTKHYLVDDGTAILNFDFFLKSTWKKEAKKIAKRILGYKIALPKYTFFSVFDLKGKNLIKNEYRFLKSFNKKKKIEREVYFIGQPLIELELMDKKTYINLLRKIVKYYEKMQRSFIYIAHRRQDEALLDIIAKEVDFTYLRFENPLEFEIIRHATLPSDFATLYSTAIVNIFNMFKETRCVAFNIESYCNAQSPFLKPMKRYYEEFDTIGIKVIRV